MPKILVKTKDASLIPKLEMGKKLGYVLSAVPSDVPVDSLPFGDTDIHGLVIDRELSSPDEVDAVREMSGDNLFPVILYSDSLTDREAGMWIGNGISDVFTSETPVPVMGKRLGNAIQLYCMSRSVHGQATDKLTGLYNRNAFYHFAKEMIAARPDDNYTVIISDVENFKRINERFGEERGDALLHYVGHFLGKMISGDVLFARYSGDQFVGLIRQVETDNIDTTSFLDDSMQKFYADAPIEHFNVKFGIYENVDKSLPVSIMCDRALIALNTIKHQYGTSVAGYTTQLQQRFAREQQILDSMEEAILEHQFEVYYQPKHDAVTSAVIGAEALVRWNHPVYGFMSPGDFIPLFERSGFITKMDEYVWTQVTLDLKSMKEKGIPTVPVSVNVSRKDLAAENFIDKLSEPLEQYSLDPSLFHVELTETVYMEDAEILAPLMKEVQKLGIKIELDDFGSGYSSLSILSQFPVDIVKLDITLIRNLEKQPAIVESIIRLMHTLGYKTTAEGVENEREVELLRKMKCDSIQGYYYSKPLTLQGFCKYITGLSE